MRDGSAQDHISAMFRSEGFAAGKHDRIMGNEYNDQYEHLGDDYSTGYRDGWAAGTPVFGEGRRDE